MDLHGGVRARASSTGRAHSFSVAAERLVVDSQGRVATFEQHVQVRSGNLVLACERLTVRYDEHGEAELLRASGGVDVRDEQGRAHAQIAELDLARRRLVLTGSPRLSRGGVDLLADRVEIELATGRASLVRPRGTFAIPAPR